MKSLTLLIILYIFSISLALSLEGNWTLTSIQSQNVSVPAIIEQYIFRSSIIMHRLTFLTCNSLSYQVSIDEDGFWVNIDSQLIDSTPNCSDNDIAKAQLIRQNIRSVLTFAIFIKELHMYNPSEEQVMIFVRSKIDDGKINEISGEWVISFNVDEKNSQRIVANSSSISACNGAIYKYTVTPPYSIFLSLQTGSCNSPQITQTFPQIAFFRKINEGIQFYDSNVNLVASAVASKDSISPISTAPQQSSTNIQPQIPVQKQKKPESLHTGNYVLLLLYRRDLMRVRAQITISSIQMSLCSKFVFNYQLGPSQSIKITSTNTPNPKCTKGDESIYFNYITSAISYTIDPDGLITLIDSANKSVVSLVQ